MCSNHADARIILEQSYGGGDTGRIQLKGKAGKGFASEFVTYARFLEEAVSAYATQNYGGKTPTRLPPFVNGRFVSVSPEHSLSRVGGGGKSAGGGSGVATWGVGKRGQLGHGKRNEEKLPKMLRGGIGYGIRIVQVSAGGGLVRVCLGRICRLSPIIPKRDTGRRQQSERICHHNLKRFEVLRPVVKSIEFARESHVVMKELI